MHKHHWQGVFPAVTTQLKQDQSLDLEATARHVSILLESGVAGLIMLGSLGENQTLTGEEKQRVLEMTVKLVHGRAPVLSGVAETSTASACRYAQDCEQIGVDGVMLMPAMVYKGDPREILNHFTTVAGTTGLPIMVYNNPISYANDLTPEMVAQLVELPNIVALKESSGNTRRITDIRNLIGQRLAIFTGVDDLILESAALGIDGWVAGAGMSMPKENQYLWNLIRQGAWEKAREFYRWFTPLMHLDTHVKFVQYIKLAIQECGLGAEWVRAPRLPLVGQEREEVLRIIRSMVKSRSPIPPLK
jgi:4-hydroxy-tetrahydrodipicolinate synthase